MRKALKWATLWGAKYSNTNNDHWLIIWYLTLRSVNTVLSHDFCMVSFTHFSNRGNPFEQNIRQTFDFDRPWIRVLLPKVIERKYKVQKGVIRAGVFYNTRDHYSQKKSIFHIQISLTTDHKLLWGDHIGAMIHSRYLLRGYFRVQK